MAEKRRVSAAKAGQGWALQKPNPGGLGVVRAYTGLLRICVHCYDGSIQQWHTMIIKRKNQALLS